MISSLRSASGVFVVVDKAESSLITEPMIPLVYKWFVDLAKEPQTPFKPAPYISLRNSVSTRSNAQGDPPYRIVRRREFYEMEGSAIAEVSPLSQLRCTIRSSKSLSVARHVGVLQSEQTLLGVETSGVILESTAFAVTNELSHPLIP